MVGLVYMGIEMESLFRWAVNKFLLSIAYASKSRGEGLRLLSSDDMEAREGNSRAADIIASMLGNDEKDSEIELSENEICDIFDALDNENIGLSSAGGVMNLIVEKICSNVRNWHDSDALLGDTLEVFVELVSTYSNSKALLSLERSISWCTTMSGRLFLSGV